MTPEFKIPFPAVDLKQALTDLVEAIAIEDAAFGRILDAESRVIEKAQKGAADVDEFEGVNLAIDNMVRSIAALQLFTRYELEDSRNLLEKIADLVECEDMEE